MVFVQTKDLFISTNFPLTSTEVINYQPQGKVKLSVCLSIGGGRGYECGVCVWCMGVCGEWGLYILPDQRHLVAVNAANGTHPTGMHSC